MKFIFRSARFQRVVSRVITLFITIAPLATEARMGDSQAKCRGTQTTEIIRYARMLPAGGGPSCLLELVTYQQDKLGTVEPLSFRAALDLAVEGYDIATVRQLRKIQQALPDNRKIKFEDSIPLVRALVMNATDRPLHPDAEARVLAEELLQIGVDINAPSASCELPLTMLLKAPYINFKPDVRLNRDLFLFLLDHGADTKTAFKESPVCKDSGLLKSGDLKKNQTAIDVADQQMTNFSFQSAKGQCTPDKPESYVSCSKYDNAIEDMKFVRKTLIKRESPVRQIAEKIKDFILPDGSAAK